jgi:hypothetical protein
MKLKQQAENLIRKHVPRLQELSFGCVVKIPIYHTVNSHSSGTYWRSHSVITIDQVSGELIVNRFQRYGNKRVSSNSEMKIIGHPIHCIDARHIIPKEKWGELIVLWEDGTLKEQPEETIDFILANNII